MLLSAMEVPGMKQITLECEGIVCNVEWTGCSLSELKVVYQAGVLQMLTIVLESTSMHVTTVCVRPETVYCSTDLESRQAAPCCAEFNDKRALLDRFVAAEAPAFMLLDETSGLYFENFVDEDIGQGSHILVRDVTQVWLRGDAQVGC
jgi:hypothetical protein